MPRTVADLAHRVDAFEDALARDSTADLAEFLPAPGDADYGPTLAELIRVDMERAWFAGRPQRLDDYRRRFPDAFARHDVLAAVAFEEYRQRRLVGETVLPNDYHRRLGVTVGDWPNIPPGSRAMTVPVRSTKTDSDTDGGPATEVLRVRPVAAAPSSVPAIAEPVERCTPVTFPPVGGQFAGFHLEEEIGRGAFGRVYLARQADLSGRPVVLKVATNVAGESRHLAQLQHTNIVPIYSYHASGELQAACMPYYGRTTLQHVLRSFRERETVPATGKDLKSTLRTADGAPPPRLPGSAPILRPPARTPPRDPGAPSGWEAYDRLAFVDAILLLAKQIADGLAHAHARGIVHSDLKPANVLLTDDGVPMLLDFNISQDTKARSHAGEILVGGTLPYMAPEQMAAYRGHGLIDARADIYSLGVILFQLLKGRHPFPERDGPPRDNIDGLIADRRELPSLRTDGRLVSRAVEAIVHKCLAFDREDRYATAADLREDLARQLEHRPLRFAPDRAPGERLAKWARRHPRLTSSAAVGALAAAVLFAAGIGLLARRERVRGLEARETFARHQMAFREAQATLDDRAEIALRPAEGLARLRAVLERYGIPENEADATDWKDRPAVRHLAPDAIERLREDVGEVFYLMAKIGHRRALAGDPSLLANAEAWNRAAASYAGDRIPRAVREQFADLAAARGDVAAEALARSEVAHLPPASPRDRYLVGYWLAQLGQPAAALPHLRAATQDDPENFSAWFMRGGAHAALGQHELAALCFGSCTALRKDFPPAWLNRGLAYAHLRFHDQARDDYDIALRLRPDWIEALLQRAASREAIGDPAGAAADLSAAIARPDAPVRALYLRAGLRQRTGDPVGAAADLTEAAKQTPEDELSWVARGESRLASDPTAALADAEEALKLNPLSVYALQLKAHVLAERLNRPAEALAMLDRAVKHYPDYVPARAGRGVLHARKGDRAAALRDAAEALQRDTKAPNLYQVGCIYALTGEKHLDDHLEARRLLRAALRTGFGLDIVDTDADLEPLRADIEFRRIVAEAKRLYSGRK